MQSAHHRVGNYCQFLFVLAFLVSLCAPTPARATDVWTNGNADSSWYVGAPAGDWSNGVPTTYTDGDDVLFDDTAPAGSYNVSIAGGGVNPSSVVVNDTLNDYTFSGTGYIGNTFAGSLTKSGDAALTISNSTAHTYTGATTVQGGTLQLDLTNLATPTNLISSNSALAMGGGTLAVTSATAGASSQTLNGASFNAGDSTVGINNTASGGGNSTTLNLGALSRSTGATVNFSAPGGVGSITTTTGNTNSIIGGWATFNNDNWAVASGPGPAHTIAALDAGSYTADTWGAGNNTDVTMDFAPAQDSTTNSLRFNQNADATVSLSSANGSTYNKIQSGGILVGSGNINTQAVPNYLITGGNLTSGTSDLIVNQHSAGSLTISSTIVDGAGPVGLTKSGSGFLTVTGANTYTGPTFVNAGIMYVQNASGSGTGYGPVNVLGGATLAGGAYSGGNSHGIIGTPSHQVSVTINSGATLAPGQGFGGQNNMVINGSLTLSDNSNLSYVLSNTDTGVGPTHGNDLLSVTGVLGLGNTVNFVPNEDFAYTPGTTYTLINGYSSLTGLGNLGSWTLSGYSTAAATGSPQPTFTQMGNSIVLNIPSYTPPSGPPAMAPIAPPIPNIPFPGFQNGAPPYEPPASPMDPKPSQHFVGCNENVTNHSGVAESSITIVLNGDWTNKIQNNYPTFGVENTILSTPAYNGTQTTFTISSKNGATIAPGKVAHVGYSLLNGMGTTGEGGSPETAAKYWGPARGTIPANPNYRLPVPTFYVADAGGGQLYGQNTQFIILYSTIELSNQNVAGEWAELQVPDAGAFKIGIANNDNNADNAPMFSFDTKFFLSDTQIPLDDLNNLYEPPTGSMWQPLPGFTDGTEITSGGISSGDISAPEPGSIVLLSLGGGLSLVWHCRRRNSCPKA